MFQSVSEHNSEQFENHQPQRTQISTVGNAPYIQNSNQIVLTATASFPSVFFQLLQYSRQHTSFSAHKAVLMTKTDLIFPVFSSRFVDFAIQSGIDNRFIYVKWLFSCSSKWAKVRFRVIEKDFEIKKLS